jgi:diguanylate cyclase (GGDEF)-like protein
VKFLNLRLKTLLLCNLSLTVLLFGIAIGIRHPILQRFAMLEQNLMQKRLTSVADAFVQNVEKLDSSAKAEAVWTEMYTYMIGRNPEFYQKTYSFEGLATSNFDVFGVLDRKGNAIHLDWIDRRSRKLKPLPDLIRNDLLEDRQLSHFPADNNPALARSRNLVVVHTAGGILLVATRPILTGDAEGPRQGAVLTGVFIDQEFLNLLEKHNELQLRLSVKQHRQSTSKQTITTKQSLTPTDASGILEILPNIHVINSQSIMGEIQLLNSKHQPIQTLFVQAPRLEYQQGEQTLNHLTGVLFLVGVPLSIIISLLLDKSIRDQQLLKASEAKLQKANQELQRFANLDSLTQIANRHCFEQYIRQHWEKGKQEQYPITLILCDVDYFKSFNDTYGHPAGDNCLYQIAQAIDRAVQQPEDLAARYGGEEFVVVLPNRNLKEGLLVAKAIQEQVQHLQIKHAGSSISNYVSISFGISSLVPNGTIVPEILVEESDKQLYIAKQRGRNQIVF